MPISPDYFAERCSSACRRRVQKRPCHIVAPLAAGWTTSQCWLRLHWCRWCFQTSRTGEFELLILPTTIHDHLRRCRLWMSPHLSFYCYCWKCCSSLWTGSKMSRATSCRSCRGRSRQSLFCCWFRSSCQCMIGVFSLKESTVEWWDSASCSIQT